MLDLSIPAVRQLPGHGQRGGPSSALEKSSWFHFHTSFPSGGPSLCRADADALQPPPSGKRGADLLAFWNGVKRHLGGGGRPRRPAGFEAAAIRGAPAGWEPGAVGPAGPKSRLRAPYPPAGLRAGGGAGRRQCPRGGSGRPRARARYGSRPAAGTGGRQAVAVATALGGRRAAPAVSRARSHTRSHTHIHTASYTSHTLRRAHAARRPEGGGSARLGGGGGGGSVLRRGGQEGWRAAPLPGSAAPCSPHGPRPRTRPGGRPAHALQRRRSNARPRAALRARREPATGDHVPGPGGGQPG